MDLQSSYFIQMNEQMNDGILSELEVKEDEQA